MTESVDFLRFPPGSAAVVTGAASGIGRAVVSTLLEAGVRVGGWDLPSEHWDRLVRDGESSHPDFRGYHLDVADADAVAAAFERVREDLGGAGHLVNNAGPPSGTPFAFQEGVAASLGSVQLVTQRWLATDSSRDGTVVNVASVSGAILGVGPTDWYVAAKAGIAGYTRHLALDRPHGIRANAVAPGIVQAPRTKELLASEAGRAVIAGNPMGRAGRPRDVAAAIAFLLAPVSDYVNGVLLPVDGGNLMTQ